MPSKEIKGIPVDQEALSRFEAKGRRIVAPSRIVHEAMGFPLVNNRLKNYLDERTDLIVKTGRVSGVRANRAREVVEAVSYDPWATVPLAPARILRQFAKIS